jgi:hypothetical protein
MLLFIHIIPLLFKIICVIVVLIESFIDYLNPVKKDSKEKSNKPTNKKNEKKNLIDNILEESDQLRKNEAKLNWFFSRKIENNYFQIARNISKNKSQHNDKYYVKVKKEEIEVLLNKLIKKEYRKKNISKVIGDWSELKFNDFLSKIHNLLDLRYSLINYKSTFQFSEIIIQDFYNIDNILKRKVDFVEILVRYEAAPAYPIWRRIDIINDDIRKLENEKNKYSENEAIGRRNHLITEIKIKKLHRWKEDLLKEIKDLDKLNYDIQLLEKEKNLYEKSMTASTSNDAIYYANTLNYRRTGVKIKTLQRKRNNLLKELNQKISAHKETTDFGGVNTGEG